MSGYRILRDFIHIDSYYYYSFVRILCIPSWAVVTHAFNLSTREA